MAKWEFNEAKPSDKNREAMQGEFFATSSPVQALVREAFQNSLDEKRDDVDGPVRIRVYVSGSNGAVSPGNMTPYLDGAWKHFEAERNELKNRPSRDEPCCFIVFEDFATKGLNGDVNQYYAVTGTKNPFYYFFRAEGQSEKSRSDRGRWGIGKFVFPRASRIKTLFGLTVRSEDNKRYLVCQAILKCHEVDGKQYHPDGWFGEFSEQKLPLPLEDNEFIKQFCKDFRLNRESETGLSIVVPYCDPDIHIYQVVKAVIKDYFYPILAGKLYVEIEDPDQKIVLEVGSLVPALEALDDKSLIDELIPRIKLASWATTVTEKEFIYLKLPPSDVAPKWSGDLISEENSSELREKLENEKEIAIRVPIIVSEKGQSDVNSFFDIFMKRDERAESGKPVFIREGIIITDVSCRPARGVLSIVEAHDEGIAKFLGDAENPAHTQWLKGSSNFDDKYNYGPSYLNFVKNSVSELIRFLSEADEKEDRTLLTDIFSIPAPEEFRKQVTKPTQPTGDGPEPPIEPIPPPVPKRYRVNKVVGGFSIVPGDAEIKLPMKLNVKVYYDMRGGKPDYSKEDFVLGHTPINIESKGIKGSVKNNQLEADILRPDFLIAVKGFDEKRDLLVHVDADYAEEKNATI